VVTQVVKLPGVAKAAMSMTKAQGKVFVASLARLEGKVTDAAVQAIAAGVKKADAATTAIVDNGNGTFSAVKGPLSKAADKVDEVAAASAARSSRKAFEAYENVAEVKPFIGTKVDPNNLPGGYLYGKIPIGKDGAGNEIYREVVYLVKPNKTKVPLKVEKGVIKTGTEGDYRIVNDKVYPKAVETIPGKPGKILGKLSQIHHMEADNMLRSTPFGQRLLRLGAANPDDALNLIELAKSKQALADARKLHPDVQFSDFIHNTQHPLFDELMQEVVDQRITAVRKAKGLTNLENPEFIPQMTKEDVQAVWIEALTRMRRGLMGEDKALYDRIEKITRPSGSIAQGESQNDTEVA
jgi:hypothetical protein